MTRALFTGAFLLIEGEKDHLVFDGFIDKNKCRIVQGFGKENVLIIASQLNTERFTGFIAVVDADFDLVNNLSMTLANVLSTDCYDLEMMIIASEAFGKVINNLGSSEKISKFLGHNSVAMLRSRILEQCIPLAALRLVNHNERLGLTFEGLDFDKFVNKKTLEIDLKGMALRVVNNSSFVLTDISALIEKLQIVINQKLDPFFVCCGHDVIRIVGIALRKVIGTCQHQQTEATYLESIFRLAYDSRYFVQTQLYARIKNWEDINVGYQVLAI